MVWVGVEARGAQPGQDVSGAVAGGAAAAGDAYKYLRFWYWDFWILCSWFADKFAVGQKLVYLFDRNQFLDDDPCPPFTHPQHVPETSIKREWCCGSDRSHRCRWTSGILVCW